MYWFLVCVPSPDLVMRKRGGTPHWLCEPAGGFSEPESGLKKILHWETRVFLLASWGIGKKGFSLHGSTAFCGILRSFLHCPPPFI